MMAMNSKDLAQQLSAHGLHEQAHDLIITEIEALEAESRNRREMIRAIQSLVKMGDEGIMHRIAQHREQNGTKT